MVVTSEFTQLMRENDNQAQWNRGSEIRPEFQSKLFIDSEQTLLNYLKRKTSEEMNNLLGHVIIKLAAAATEKYQALEVGNFFKLLPKEIKKSTMNAKSNAFTDE